MATEAVAEAVVAPQDGLEDFRFWLRYPPEGRRGMADTTLVAWCYSVQRLLRFLGDEELSEDGVRRWIHDLEKGNSPRSIGRHLDAIRAYFQFKGLTLNIGSPFFVRKLPRWLSQTEWARLLDVTIRPLYDPKASEQARYRALFNRAALLVYGGSGLRLTEGITLRRDKVDPRGFLTVIAKGGVEQVRIAPD